jgi:hypothetical protein
MYPRHKSAAEVVAEVGVAAARNHHHHRRKNSRQASESGQQSNQISSASNLLVELKPALRSATAIVATGGHEPLK